MTTRIWRNSIRTRLMLWYSAFVVVLFVVVMASLLLWQHLTSLDYYQSRLSNAVQLAAASLTVTDDGYAFDPEFDLEDVRVSLLDADGTPLLGRWDFGIVPREARMRSSERRDGSSWHLLDHAVELDGRELWVRCYMSSTVTDPTGRALMLMLIISAPLLLLIIVIGGGIITRRALQPLAEITSTAESISNSGDLDQRIHLDQRTDEVGRLATAFNNMLKRLQRSIELEKCFISDASHELRTPLSVISAQSEFALTPGRSPEEKDAALEVIRARSDRAGEMLGQMLLLSRMDSHRLPLRREQVELSELTEGVAEELRMRAEERGIEILCRAEPNVQIEGDELLLMRMLTNLIQNAIQYGLPGGHIWIDLKRAGKYALLAIADDGPGIAPEEQDRIWQRFYQVSKTSKHTEGSGLGLPIVRWIAETHGGKIELQSAPGKGSTFTVELPI